VIAALVYGVSTIAMSETAIGNALAEDVAHKLATAHPTGAIRLMILAQDGGDERDVRRCTSEPPKSLSARADGGTGKPGTSAPVSTTDVRA
jgi:hypothetical protein